MAAFGLSIGCLCCGLDCRTIRYPADFPSEQWDVFEINEGSSRPSSEAFPQLLTTGQRLKPPSNGLQASAEAWYHRIRFSGDIDLEWDDLIIEVRPDGGLLNSAGSTIAIMPPTDTSAITTLWTDVMFVVTPDWYGVWFYNMHRNNFHASPFFGFFTSRGAIQVVDRLNDPSVRDVLLTSRSDSTLITSWQVSDMSARIAGDSIVEACPMPIPPDGTEYFHQSQRLGSNTANGVRSPNSFASSDLFNAIASGGPADWDWEDYITAGGNLPPDLASVLEPLSVLHNGHNQFLGLILSPDPWPSPVGSAVDKSKRIARPFRTAENPYPKPVAIYALGLRQRGTSITEDTDVQVIPYNASGKAPTTLNVSATSELSWTVY